MTFTNANCEVFEKRTLFMNSKKFQKNYFQKGLKWKEDKKKEQAKKIKKPKQNKIKTIDKFTAQRI